MKILATILTYLLSLAVIACLAFVIVIVLAGPHAGLLPYWLESTVAVTGWLSVLVFPILLARKVFWHTRLVGGNVWIGDPTEALYVESAVPHVLEVARGLAESGLMTIEGEWASANAALMAQSEKFEADMKSAQADLEKKHAFEDARRTG